MMSVKCCFCLMKFAEEMENFWWVDGLGVFSFFWSMNRSFRAEESALRELQQQMGSFRNSVVKEKEEELGLFLEMRRREKERNDLLLFQNGDEFDAPLGEKTKSFSIEVLLFQLLSSLLVSGWDFVFPLI